MQDIMGESRKEQLQQRFIYKSFYFYFHFKKSLLAAKFSCKNVKFFDVQPKCHAVIRKAIELNDLKDFCEVVRINFNSLIFIFSNIFQ